MVCGFGMQYGMWIRYTIWCMVLDHLSTVYDMLCEWCTIGKPKCPNI